MWQLVRAEWTKLTRHRAAMFGLLGIFPTCGLLFMVLTATAVRQPAARRLIEDSLTHWGDLLTLAWLVPSNFFGRLFLVAFAAFVFGAEYQWATLKSLTPRAGRRALVLAKLAVMTALVVLTFSLFSLILAAGGVGLSSLAGFDVAPAFSIGEIAAQLRSTALAATLGFLAFLITGIAAAVGAILTRSILGGTLTGMSMVFLDPALLTGARIASDLASLPAVLHVGRLSPFYNLENVRSWLTFGSPSEMLHDGFTKMGLAAPVDPLWVSLGVLALWVVGGVALTSRVFESQDITG